MATPLDAPKHGHTLTSDDFERINAAEVAGRSMERRLDRHRQGVRECPVRVEFLRRKSPTLPAPPMMKILGQGGGRGGDVRLKLYLSLLWASPGGEHDTQFRAANWAQILGLPEYARKGKRRIYDAVGWLEEHHFVTVDRHTGRPSMVTVRHESGTGLSYTIPSNEVEVGGDPVYRRLQHTWWTSGWIAGLSGRALMFWLVLMDETANGTRSGPCWLSESQTKDKYAISPHLRQRALRELEAHRLISTRRKWANEPFGGRSSRTEITVRPKRLKSKLSETTAVQDGTDA